MRKDPYFLSPLAPGYRLDRYELLCPVAEGGMAQVWVARQRGKHGFERLVAIKTILPKFSADVRFEQMFLDEARIASQIEHANVAQILDVGDEQGVLYLVMEWVDGDSLSRVHKAFETQGRLIPHGILLRVVADACSGLHAAHELRAKDGAPLCVVHRDVSPQNLLVSTKGVAKLIDFGIAKAQGRISSETRAGAVKGKVQYMAPEQAAGDEVDRRADVWAAGVILYHYLGGRPPFDGPNELATLKLLTAGKAPEPLPPSVPRSIAAVAMRALSATPDARFASAAAMAAAIEGAMLEAGCATTTTDVAAFSQQHLADRAARRQRALKLSLAAAAERARMQAILRHPRADSVVSLADVDERVARELASPEVLPLPEPTPPEPEPAAPPPPPLPAESTPMLTPVLRSRPTGWTIGGAGTAGLVFGALAMLAMGSSRPIDPPAAPVADSMATAVRIEIAAPPPPPAVSASAPTPAPLVEPPEPGERAGAPHAAPPAAPSPVGSGRGRQRPVAAAPPRPAANPRSSSMTKTSIPEVIGDGF